MFFAIGRSHGALGLRAVVFCRSRAEEMWFPPGSRGWSRCALTSWYTRNQEKTKIVAPTCRPTASTGSNVCSSFVVGVLIMLEEKRRELGGRDRRGPSKRRFFFIPDVGGRWSARAFDSSGVGPGAAFASCITSGARVSAVRWRRSLRKSGRRSDERPLQSIRVHPTDVCEVRTLLASSP